MRKQAGQAFILVLILLGVGALLVVPALRLTGTSLTSSQIVERQVKGLYAADAAQEYILWKLLDPNWRNEYVSTEGVAYSFKFNVCDVPVSASVVMRAMESTGGITLATEDKIKPTKTVEPNSEDTYTYIITMDYLSDINEENPQVYLDAIYDFLPAKINNYIGPSEVFVDGEWHEVPGPDDSQLISNNYLKWPADYNKDTSEGAFSSHLEFLGIEDFEVREVKKLRFKVSGSLGTGVHCNWVVLKMEDGTNTVSGPQAPITVGLDEPGECLGDSVMGVTKEADPKIIQPGVEQEITYTLYITNLYTQTRDIEEITDYLAPGFEYVKFLDSEIVFIDEEGIEHWIEDIQILELDPLALDEPERSNPENDISLLNINGVDRQQLRWRTPKFPLDNFITIQSNETLKLTFKAQTTKEVSGSYYNEVTVTLKDTGLPPGFAEAGVLRGEFGTNYSWLTGTVFVPAYDSSSEAEGITINANMALIELGGITITSWGVD